MNLDPLQAGLFLLPNTLMTAFFAPLAGYLSDKRGPRAIATVGLVTTAAGLLLLTQLPATVTFWQLALPLALVGAGIGIFAPPNRSSVMSSVAPEDRGIAAGISTTLINLGNSVSRSLAFVLMAAVVPVAVIDNMFAGVYAGSAASFAGNFVDGVHLVFYVSAGFVLISIIPSILRGSRSAPEEEADVSSIPVA
jgi:MFS family permease